MRKTIDLLLNVLTFSLVPVFIDSMAKEYPLNTIFGLAVSVNIFLLAFMIPILLSIYFKRFGFRVLH